MTGDRDAGALAGLGRRLARAGLTERAARACFGVGAIAHVARATADRAATVTRAAVPLWLFCAGRAVDRDAARAAFGDDDLAALAEAGLITIAGAHVRAARGLVPIGPSIAVCDRADARGDDVVLWPDDSSHHLIGALPRARVGRWLDVGCGSALAPLARPGGASEIRATDVSRRAVAAAAQGAALSGLAHVATAVADLLAGAGDGWDLISFNAPIPAEASGATLDGDPLHRRAPAGARILERFWAEVPARVRDRDGAEVVVHSFVPSDPLAPLAHLPGAVVVARYATDPGFAITWWQPTAPPRRQLVDVTLTVDAPHVTRAALDP